MMYSVYAKTEVDATSKAEANEIAAASEVAWAPCQSPRAVALAVLGVTTALNTTLMAGGMLYLAS